MFPTLLRRSAAAAASQHASTAAARPFNFATNPYKAKRPWPPDMSKLSNKHQFRLERKYKRRSKLKWARPRFMIFTSILQWSLITAFLTYGVLFYSWDDSRAFAEQRAWVQERMRMLFGTTPPRGAAALKKEAGGETESPASNAT